MAENTDVEELKAQICDLCRDLGPQDSIDVARLFYRMKLGRIIKYNPDGAYIDLDAIPKDKHSVIIAAHNQIVYKLGKNNTEAPKR